MSAELEWVPAEALTSRSDRIRCVQLRVICRAGVCADRQRDSRVLTNGDGKSISKSETLALCRDCSQGHSVLERVGASPPRNTSLANNPVALTRRPAAGAAAVSVGSTLASNSISTERLEAARARGLARTHCARGHEYGDYVAFGHYGQRKCIACRREDTAKHNAKRQGPEVEK